jgi:hypothetical protein
MALLVLALALGVAGVAAPDASVAIDWSRPVANSSTAVRCRSASACDCITTARGQCLRLNDHWSCALAAAVGNGRGRRDAVPGQDVVRRALRRLLLCALESRSSVCALRALGEPHGRASSQHCPSQLTPLPLDPPGALSSVPEPPCRRHRAAAERLHRVQTSHELEQHHVRWRRARVSSQCLPLCRHSGTWEPHALTARYCLFAASWRQCAAERRSTAGASSQ